MRCMRGRAAGSRVFFVAILVALVAASIDVNSPVASGTASYTVSDVAAAATVETNIPFPNWMTAINNLGWIVGNTSMTASGAFLYNGSVIPIGTFGGTGNRAYGLNLAGDVVGFADTKKNSHAFRRTYSSGAMTDLGVLNNNGYSFATDINSSGLIVGGATAAGSPGNEHAFKRSSTMQDLGTLPGDTLSQARGVNASGVIVGRSWNGSADHAFRYSGSSMTNIGTLGGAWAEANDINDSGVIVGASTVLAGQWHAFSYNGTVMTDLTPTASFATALGVNSFGEVVGIADGHGFLYSAGVTYDLNTLIPSGTGWSISAAHDINDGGKIVGVGVKNAANRTFILVPNSNGLLARFAPQVRYDSGDGYRATAVETITDNYVAGEPLHSDLLWAGAVENLAASDPSYAEDDLNIAYLGANYPAGGIANGRPSSVGDYIGMVAGSHDADAARMQPIYGDRTYGRVITMPDGSAVVQYWFWYWFNWHPLPSPYGDHEGDWEMVQVRIDPLGTPTEATYAQHVSGERCDWVHVPRVPNSTRLVVYVAKGSHASYFSAGTHVYQGGAFADLANGATAVNPVVVDVGTAPSWLSWLGHWGGTGTSGAESPVGPALHSQFNDPLTWTQGAAGCTESQVFP